MSTELFLTAIAVITIIPAAVAALVDWQAQRVPNSLVLATLAPAVLAVVVADEPIASSVAMAVGAGTMALPLLLVHILSPLAMGFGDVKLATSLGASVGVIAPHLALPVLASAAGLTLIVACCRRRVAVPFAPGLVAGTAAALALGSFQGWGFAAMTTQLSTPPLERTEPSSNRPVSPPRGFRPASRRRARIAVGAFVAAIAVVGNLLVYSSLDHKTEVLQVVRDIPAGEIVSASDLRVVAVDVDATVATVAPSDIGSVANQYARVHIAAGTLMVPVLVQPTPLVTRGQGVVAVEIRPSQLPAGLHERSRVMLVVVDHDGSPGLVTEGRVVARRRDRVERKRLGIVGRSQSAGRRCSCRRRRRPCRLARPGRRPSARERYLMAIVAVIGDACTTTTVALASAWPAASEVLIVEADPTGGDLAAWFDLPILPSLSTVVTTALDASWSEIDRHTRLAPSGLRLICAPPSAVEARSAVAESARTLVRTLAASVAAGCDRRRRTARRPPELASARGVGGGQGRRASSACRVGAGGGGTAATARRTARRDVRLAGGGRRCRHRRRAVRLDQIEQFVADAAGNAPLVGLPVDALTAAVYAGRRGAPHGASHVYRWAAPHGASPTSSRGPSTERVDVCGSTSR